MLFHRSLNNSADNGYRFACNVYNLTLLCQSHGGISETKNVGLCTTISW